MSKRKQPDYLVQFEAMWLEYCRKHGHAPNGAKRKIMLDGYVEGIGYALGRLEK